MDQFDNFDDFDRHFNSSNEPPTGNDEMTDDFLTEAISAEPSEPQQKRQKFRRAVSRSDASSAAPEKQPTPIYTETESVQSQPEPIRTQSEPIKEYAAPAATAEEIWAAAAEKVAASPDLPQTDSVSAAEPTAETTEEPAEESAEESAEAQPEEFASAPMPPSAASEEMPEKAHTRSVRATAAQLLQAYIDCPSKLIKSGTDVNEINQRYLSGLKYGAEWGFSTIIIPVSQELANHLYQAGHGQPLSIDRLRESRSDMLLASDSITGEAFIDSSYEQKISYMERRNIDVEAFVNAPVQGKAINCFSSFVSQSKTICDVIMAQIPTTNPWEVFVWLPVGGINGAPSDQELMAVSRTWHDMCGALPAVLGYGAVEYFVPHGKPSPKEAHALAKGHFAVCPERVLRLTKSHCLGELADTLTKSCVWYLGWN